MVLCFMMSTNNNGDIEQNNPVLDLEQDQWNFSDWCHPERSIVSESSSDEGDDSMGDSAMRLVPRELYCRDQ